MPCVALADGHPRSIMVGPPGECIETEGTEKDRKYESIPRKFVEMLLRRSKRRFRMSLDSGCDDLDVLSFAPRRPCGQTACVRSLSASLNRFAINLMHP